MKKLTRSQAADLARSAYKVPDGIVAIQLQSRLPEPIAKTFRNRDSRDRGRIIQIGETIDKDGYLLLYQIVHALGGNIISTIVGDDITIVARTKSYQGSDQFELLLEIIKDLCDEKHKGVDRDNKML